MTTVRATSLWRRALATDPAAADSPYDSLPYGEVAQLDATSLAMLNILEDSNDEKELVESAQRALLNILEDATEERTRRDETNHAILNILEDARDEKVRVEDGQRALMNILEDLDSEKAKVETVNRDLARSNGELEQFAYITSHDLREPLRAVSGPISLLARRYGGRLDAEADTLIRFAVDGCARMTEMIDDILLFSRVGHTAKRLRRVDIDDVLRSVLDSLGPVMNASGAVIEAEELPRVTAEPTQVAQVFENLLSNAMKFVPEGTPPRITIRSALVDDMWQISISDNGIGITPGHRDRVWGMFRRLHTVDQYPGTGMGLAIVKKIVEHLGGRVGIEGVHPGPGSTFWFTLPSKEPAA